jgi:small-conductance mechanosensitive channel
MLIKWIPIEKIQWLINYEAFAIITFLMLMAFGFYSIFLRKISARRHGQLKHRFLVTTSFVILTYLFIGLHWALYIQYIDSQLLLKISSYLGLISLILGAVSVIRVAQIYIYLYLFLVNMVTGVPRLIGNLFTFVFSILVFGMIGSYLFNFNIVTLATTSAVFSLVLGLALQDTLGNLFSGLALQIDRPFQINDWVEIQINDQKWIGQIQEINWRATSLLTFADELMVFPNKTIAQSQIMVLSHTFRPIRLNQVFRFTHDTPIEKAKQALLEGIEGNPHILSQPGPTVLLIEATESWLTVKIFYSLRDYGTRYRVGDDIITKMLMAIQKHNLKLAHQVLSIRKELES